MSMINAVRTIEKKRDGEELTDEEIFHFIRGISDGSFTDYQASALLMAIYFQGMSLRETVALTKAMVESGEHYDLSHIPGVKVDKHSTGGVGDKVSLILAPLAAACGLRVPMMSGRGLGHTGGTLDKLESISGFDVRLNRERFEEVLTSTGCAMIGQTDTIAPADKKLYALRDVTGTVECIPLIVASILSKKIAEGTDALVLDVKVGSGAFMKKKNSARQLARCLTKVAQKLGLKCRALLTNMDQPLGYAVGNSVEVIEAIEVLRNQKPCENIEEGDGSSSDLKELTVQICAQMLQVGGVVRTLTEGRKLAHQKLADGSAWETFKKMVEAQGGALDQISDLSKLPHASRVLCWKSRKRGYISKFDTFGIGKILVELGGGRTKAADRINPGVGLVFHKKLGARVKPGDSIATVYATEKTDLSALEEQLEKTVQVLGTRKPVPKLILDPQIK